MFSWGSRRKFIYIASAVFFILFIFVAILILIFYQRPSCTDGKQNGDEQGIDCGGSCGNVCSSEAKPLLIDWARAFKVKDKYWSIAAYVENPNGSYEAQNVAYVFKVYDENNLLIIEKRGITFVPATGAFGVLEGGLYFGDRVPSRVTFEWQGDPVWAKTSSTKDLITIKDITRSVDVDGLSKISATVLNEGIRPITNILGFVILYNYQGEAIAVSQTLVDQVNGGEKGNMVFSWPTPFKEAVNRVEIMHWIVPNSN